jgi:hypothetical protein
VSCTENKEAKTKKEERMLKERGIEAYANLRGYKPPRYSQQPRLRRRPRGGIYQPRNLPLPEIRFALEELKHLRPFDAEQGGACYHGVKVRKNPWTPVLKCLLEEGMILPHSARYGSTVYNFLLKEAEKRNMYVEDLLPLS